jgi:anthranilate synthase
MSLLRYATKSGIQVTRNSTRLPFRRGLNHLLSELDRHRGVYLSSGYEYPERYSRWDVAALRPPLEIVGRGRRVEFRPLNARGQVLARLFHTLLARHPHWESLGFEGPVLAGRLKPLPGLFPEEERSKQPSAFSILRALVQEFGHPKDGRLVLAGAFGYDLLFQFDPIRLRLPRGEQKDLHLFFCDDIHFMDRKREVIERFQYDFARGEDSTANLPRDAEELQIPPAAGPLEIVSDHTPEQYMEKVERVRAGMKQGDYYEVVLRQSFSSGFGRSPGELFHRIQELSPSPYQFLLQLGDEQLVGASPEMFIRVEGRRVESCPIAGTARRTGDPLRDHDLMRDLLNSPKEESELTMCTDVDRNDKSRVSVPGSVKVIGRRLIERYAGLFHTVDHVEGTLAPGFDSLDAFLSHMWAVTVVGAPKKAAAQAIEDLENDPRGWYGGAIGLLSLNGDLNTGILIRTVHLKDGIARYAAGATLLYDSEPAAEEQETRLKAASFFSSLHASAGDVRKRPRAEKPPGKGVRLLLVDNDDCFIQTLANYVRQTGAEVMTYRSGFPLSLIDELQPDILLISPGPGRPADFGVPDLVRYAAARALPAFGVCLGLQGMVEGFGGELGVLPYPVHGKPSLISHHNVGVFEGLPQPLKVGRYHSLYAIAAKLPAELEVTSVSEDGIIMGIRHRTLPMEAVQFHPESLLSQGGGQGLMMIRNLVRLYGHRRTR